MNCEECETRLLDLLYEEEGPGAVEAREHAEGCDSCKDALARLRTAQRLAAELPLVEPPAALDLPILEAARQKAEGQSESLWSAVLRWVGGAAMRPQFAMATVMMLVVAIGLYYFPNTDHPPQTGVTVNPEPGLVGPSQGALEEAAEAESDLALGDEGTAGSVGGIERSADLEAQKPQTRLALRREARNRTQMRARPRSSPQALPREELAQEMDEYESEFGQAEEPAIGDDLGATQDGRALDRPRPSNSPQNTMDFSGPAQRSAPSSSTRGSARMAVAPTAPAAEPALRGGGASTGTRDSLTATALHRLARNQRSAGDCGQAVQQYTRLLSRFPRYGQAPQAMIELAGCYRRLGRLSEARTWLTRAQRHTAVAAIARRELVLVDAMDRAGRRNQGDVSKASRRRAAPAAAEAASE